MRTLFWFLLLGNAVLFAVMQRGGIAWGEQAYQAQPALHAEKIRLLAAPRVSDKTEGAAGIQAKLVVPPPAEAAKPADNTAKMDKPLPAGKQESAEKTPPATKPAPLATKQTEAVCLEWGDFSGDDLKRATELLSTLKLGDKLSQRQIEYDKGYWVYMPPQKNKAGVRRKIAQLKARNVNEYFVIWNKGEFQYAISLGVFKTREAAENHLKKLRTQDVRTARVGERNSKLKTTLFELNEVDALIEGKLKEANKDFHGSELKNVPCALTR